MSMTMKLILSTLAVAIGGATGYWELHMNDVIGAKFWIGFALASLTPVGAYYLGLFQLKPGDA